MAIFLSLAIVVMFLETAGLVYLTYMIQDLESAWGAGQAVNYASGGSASVDMVGGC